MLSSPEDAIAFFRRWEEQKVFVSVGLEVGKLIVSANARISFKKRSRFSFAIFAPIKHCVPLEVGKNDLQCRKSSVFV